MNKESVYFIYFVLFDGVKRLYAFVMHFLAACVMWRFCSLLILTGERF